MAWAIPVAMEVGKAVLIKKGTDALTKKPADAIMKPAAPTLDDAAKNRDELDQIKRRKGVLSTIFGGAEPGAASPTVGTKQLLGA